MNVSRASTACRMLLDQWPWRMGENYHGDVCGGVQQALEDHEQQALRSVPHLRSAPRRWRPLTQQSPTVFLMTLFHSTAHLDHRPKTLDRRQRRIQCAAAVVADDHAARAGLNRQNSILGAQNPLRATHEKDDRHALSVGAGMLAKHKVRLPS